jgi:hypothetical protein
MTVQETGARGLLPRRPRGLSLRAADAMLAIGLGMAGLLLVLTLVFGLNPPASANTVA